MGLLNFFKNPKKQEKSGRSVKKQPEKETVSGDKRLLAIKAADRTASHEVKAASPSSEKTLPDSVPEPPVETGPSLQKVSPSLSQELPDNYGDNEIYLLVRDPLWIYVYWEIQDDHQKKHLDKLGGSLDHVASILRIYDVSDKKNGTPVTDIVLKNMVRYWYFNAQPNHDYYAEIGLLHKDGRFRVLARSNRVTTPRSGMSEIIDDRWMSLDFDKLYALSGGFEAGKSSEELTKLMEERFTNAVTSGSGASAASSFSSPVKIQKRGFPFWLECELIIYGGTEPDAQVTMQGRPVQLRSDGTFSFRYALPDGKFIYDCRAESSDGIEKRVIVPIVSRSTERPEPVLKAISKNTSESLVGAS